MIYGYARCSTEPENIKFSGSFVLLLQQSHLQSSRGLCNIVLVEHRGVEPLAFTMRMWRATNCANAPYAFIIAPELRCVKRVFAGIKITALKRPNLGGYF